MTLVDLQDVTCFIKYLFQHHQSRKLIYNKIFAAYLLYFHRPKCMILLDFVLLVGTRMKYQPQKWPDLHSTDLTLADKTSSQLLIIV